MAGTNLKLANKLARRAKYIKEKQRGKYDRENKLESTMRKSPRAYELSRKAQRRDDRNFGNDVISQKPVLAFVAEALTLDRHDYGGSDFGMRLTLAAGLEAAIGLQPGDVIQILEGNANNQQLDVVALTDSTHVRLEDLPSYAYAGLPEITQIVTVADVAGSLNNTYFYINGFGDSSLYYIWYNVSGGGTDPAIPGRTGVEVDISTGDSAVAVATATVGAFGPQFLVSRNNATLTITNNGVGATTDASDAGATGFSISVLQQGTDANPSPSESDIYFRAFLSSEKAQYE